MKNSLEIIVEDMINLLLKVYCLFYSRNDLLYSKTHRPLLCWLFANVMYRCCATLLTSYIKLKYAILPIGPFSEACVNDDLVVSLTTFPKRISSVWIVLLSLLKQTVRPGVILLVLSKDEYPDGMQSVPDRLKGFEKYGVKIVFDEGNMKPHKKYLWAFEHYPQQLVVTVDDDKYYDTHTLEWLLVLHKKYPDAICANNARRIVLKGDDFTLYKEWKSIEEESAPSHLNLAIGFGGVLYPYPYRFKARVSDRTLISATSLNADDLWLKANEIYSQIPVCVGPYRSPSPTISGTNVSSLKRSNVNKEGKSQNDEQWNRLLREFHFTGVR